MAYLSNLVKSGVLAGALAAAPLFAQTVQPGPAYPNNTENGSRANSNGYNAMPDTNSPYTEGGLNNSGGPYPYTPTTGHNYGWIGLFGLAGLAGLFGGRRRAISTEGDSLRWTERDRLAS